MAALVNARRSAASTASLPPDALRVLLLLDDACAGPLVAELAALQIDAAVLSGDDWSAGDIRAIDMDAIVVQIDDPLATGRLRQLLDATGGQVPVIVAIDELTVAVMRRLLHLGATDVLPRSFAADDLWQSLEAARRARRGTIARPQRQRGRIVSFLGTMGGVGNSSIATQTGILWAGQHRVCYIDFDLQFGNAALLLDLHPSLHIGHLIDEGEGIDADFLRSVAIQHRSGLSVVASPTEMMPIEVIDSQFVDRLLRLACGLYDVVIADLPALWSEWTMYLLKRSDTICLVTDPGVPSLYQARRQLDMIGENGLSSRLKVIANRVEKRFLSKTNLKEVEEALGRDIEFTVANDYPTVSAANNQGRAVGDVRPGSRVLKDLVGLARELSATIETGEAQP